MRDREKYNAYHKEYQLKRYHRRRAEAIEKLGSKCSVCGIVADLEIDHIDWRLKEIPINKLWGISNERFYAELAKCQLLCERHHIAKTSLEISERRPMTHGLYWAAYKRNCQCQECLDFRVEYNKQRKEQRRNKRL